MIKAMLNAENNQDISNAKEKDIVQKNIDKFIAEAPDDKYLMFKARIAEELCQMSLNNIDLGNRLVGKHSRGPIRFSGIHFRDPRRLRGVRQQSAQIARLELQVARTFIVITETYIDLYRTYLALRPAHMPTDIARLLKFPNSELLYRTLFPSDIG
ncbi:hypothetical protein NQ317_006748 [Molorchus minor]|uniref:Uncharacterized protein n=1 Tax=Molorchus minor TaxID=1323400 RepID=A0ABQ9JC07_9CUCU|nr:hypothetical protein NQ317_006748 [Molorchus minor]